MPTTPVTTPSGEVIQVNHPEGASQADIIKFAAASVGIKPTARPVMQRSPQERMDDISAFDRFIYEFAASPNLTGNLAVLAEAALPMGFFGDPSGEGNGFYTSPSEAYGEDYDVEITCPACGEKHKHTIDLQQFEEKDINWEGFEDGNIHHKFTLPACKKEVTLKMLTHGDEKKIEELAKANKKKARISGIDRELTSRLKRVIVSVDGESDQAYINKFVDNMLSRDSLALRKYLKEATPDVDTTIYYECGSCGHEVTNMQLPIDVGFFWPGV